MGKPRGYLTGDSPVCPLPSIVVADELMTASQMSSSGRCKPWTARLLRAALLLGTDSRSQLQINCADCRTVLLRHPLRARCSVPCCACGRGVTACLPDGVGSMAGIPRIQRLCPLCSDRFPDKKHLLKCSAVALLRSGHSALFQGPRTTREFMWQDGDRFVAAVRYAVDAAGSQQGSDS